MPGVDGGVGSGGVVGCEPEGSFGAGAAPAAAGGMSTETSPSEESMRTGTPFTPEPDA